MLKIIINVPWYVTNDILYDLNISLMGRRSLRQKLKVQSYSERISNHPNVLTKHTSFSKETQYEGLKSYLFTN